MPKEKPVNYDEPIQVRLRAGYGPVLMLANALNGTLPVCDCHSLRDDQPSSGAYLHPGQVIWMRRGEALGEPNADGVMSSGRRDFEPVTAEPAKVETPPSEA